MIRSIAEDTAAYRCLELIDRCAPRMMKAGGGGLKGEYDEGHANPVTREQSAEFRRLHSDGGLSVSEIALRFGRSTGCVLKHVRGICFRGLRKSKHIDRAPEVEALFAAGKSKIGIARETGLPVHIVYYLIQKLQRAEQHAA